MNVNENIIAVCGPVNAGKSSLVGVLTTGELDDGRGGARNKILIHQHERETGRTSNITINPIIYQEEDGLYLKCVPNSVKKLRIPKKKLFEPGEYINKLGYKKKIISFMDLAGHEKYLKTTVYGVTGMFPDYGLLIIGANTGITRLTKEHLGILLYLKIPIIIIITKIDMAPSHIYKTLKNRLKKLISKTSFNKVIYYINSTNSNKETEFYIENFNGNPDIIPIISVSNKQGINIMNLHNIFFNLPNHKKWENNSTDGTIVYLDNNYIVPGVGMVLSGTVKGNSIKVKQKMYLGPFNGVFKQVVIRSIHNSVRENMDMIEEKKLGCFNIKFVNNKETVGRKMIKKGMVMIDDINKWTNNISRTFLAKVNILHHATTIKNGYSPVIHCGPIRQTARIKIVKQKNNKSRIRTGDTCLVEFTFTCHDEFIEKDMILFFRDGNTKGVGEVIKVI
tara:strand:+ start:6982 stop:8331 length:1350 start_codon:yes stop_codon:yes gene_type:complete